MKQRYIWPITEQQVIGPPQGQILRYIVKAENLQIGKAQGHAWSLNHILKLAPLKILLCCPVPKNIFKRKTEKRKQWNRTSKATAQKILGLMGGPFGGRPFIQVFFVGFCAGVGRTIFAALFLSFVTMPTPDFTKNNSSLAQPIPFLVFNVCCDTIAIYKKFLQKLI
ncbi:hypothetical protein [Taibaiella chishuiensis]|uniref:hypothetical protein n=1 Tax=Taibaiella chishuiensis TaxID=1434707 RepID=UPI000D0D2B27|nr:hypothetical protein [Taibaiella chishuiensis]